MGHALLLAWLSDHADRWNPAGTAATGRAHSCVSGRRRRCRRPWLTPGWRQTPVPAPCAITRRSQATMRPVVQPITLSYEREAARPPAVGGSAGRRVGNKGVL